jgi:release factor glutamine methyltransferase
MGTMLIDTGAYVETLASAGVPNPQSETAKIIDLVRGTKGGEFSLSKKIDVSETEKDKIEEIIAKRAKRIPFSRLLETVRFADIEIETGEGVHAPASETEGLIDHAVLLLEGQGAARIVDLGTGSGCILLGLLYALPEATGLGIDHSEAAIDLSRKNAAKNNLQTRAEFRVGDWSNGIAEAFDLVVSNPPRSATENIKLLLPEMRDHDPHSGLDGVSDGVDFFRKLADDFHRIAKKGAYGLFQLGPKYAGAVEQIFHEHGFKNTEMKLNYLGLPLCLLVVNER